jgi:hypothetical protein
VVDFLITDDAGDLLQLRRSDHRSVGQFVAIQSVMLAVGIRHLVDWPPGAIRVSGLVGLCVRWMREALCTLRGHDMVLVFEPGRLSLACLGCGTRTKGWTIDVNPAYRGRGRRYEPKSPGTQLKAA